MWLRRDVAITQGRAEGSSWRPHGHSLPLHDSGVANHKPNARAVDGCSHLAQVGDAEA